jgi:hypothetical protein
MSRPLITLVAWAVFHLREAIFQLRVGLAAVRVLERAAHKRLPYVWFDGIEDWKVNEMARAEIEQTDAPAVAEIIRAARAERNRRYPARVGLPNSTATRRFP